MTCEHIEVQTSTARCLCFHWNQVASTAAVLQPGCHQFAASAARCLCSTGPTCKSRLSDKWASTAAVLQLGCHQWADFCGKNLAARWWDSEIICGCCTKFLSVYFCYNFNKWNEQRLSLIGVGKKVESFYLGLLVVEWGAKDIVEQVKSSSYQFSFLSSRQPLGLFVSH